MKKLLVAAAFAVLAFAQGANAQTNLQTFYDFGKDRQYVTTTFEMFKSDGWGNTFFFIDHYYGKEMTAGSAINGSYFEVERAINFWGDSALKDLSLHVEYDGSTWGSAIWCFGLNYFLHSDDYKNTFTAYLMYDLHRGIGEADIPIKFSGVWGCTDIFGLDGMTFKGFIDVWGNNSVWGLNDVTKFSVLAEPQLWYRIGDAFNCPNFNIGTEVELSYNFAGNKGFMCNPCLGIKYEF